jgi:hypothetical protein
MALLPDRAPPVTRLIRAMAAAFHQSLAKAHAQKPEAPPTQEEMWLLARRPFMTCC